MDTPGVTLRSFSGNRDAVVLDDNYGGAEIISDVEGDLCDYDIDGDSRPSGAARDIGADEITDLCKSITNGLWRSQGIWENNSVPTLSSSVLIDSNTQVTIDEESECHYIVAASLSTLSIADKGNLTVKDAY